MNNIITAKNTFGEGLIMDFAPDNTLANVLTSALNATLLTFNGNEMSLQNDMGNGRVETARLPEGYIPMGSCEFGDIIYIISYNPLLNRSQIGCFPSPERNITLDEISTLENQSVGYKDFQAVTGKDGQEKITGRLNATTLKKVLIDKTINPGDLYIIYTDTLGDNKECLSDLGNTSHTHNTWPKLVKVHVVSLEESGKITYLDLDIKWYNDFYIKNNSSSSNIQKDIDEYRTLVDSAYSVFQSKISGKLALLFELEQINGFSGTYSIYELPETEKQIEIRPNENIFIKYKNYSIFLNTSWETKNKDVNPYGVVLTESKLKGSVYPYKETAEDTGIYEKDNIDLLSRTNSKNLEHITTVPPISKDTDEIYNNIFTYINYEKKEEGSNEPIVVEPYQYENYEDFIVNNYKSQIAQYSNCKNIILDTEALKTEKKSRYYINESTTSKPIHDLIVNSYFNKDVIKYFYDISIPYKLIISTKSIQLDLTGLIHNFSIVPSMSYGLLENLKVNLSIDFSKINTGKIDLIGWRYYNKGLNSTLTFDLECYPEPNKDIKEVVLLFYDNQGFAAAYHINNKSSYSGSFTEILELNKQFQNYKLNDIDYKGVKQTHAGLESDNGTIYIQGNTISLSKPSSENYKTHLNDAGTIYSNMLYKVLIVVKYCSKDSYGKLIEDPNNYKYFTRWFYTLELFNDFYYTNKDFQSLTPELTFDNSVEITLDPSDSLYILYKNNTVDEETTVDNTIGANVYAVNPKDKSNITFKVQTGLLENYGVFNLKRVTDVNKDPILLKVVLGESLIILPEQIDLVSEVEVPKNDKIFPLIYTKEELNEFDWVEEANIGSTLFNLLESTDSQKIGNNNLNIYGGGESYKKYKDCFSLKITKPNNENVDNQKDESYSYINSKGVQIALSNPQSCTDRAINVMDKGIGMTLKGLMFNKFIFSQIEKDSNGKQLKSIINLGRLESYGLHLKKNNQSNKNHLYFNDIQTLFMGESKGHSTRWGGSYIQGVDEGWQSTIAYNDGDNGHDGWNPDLLNETILNIFYRVNNYLTPLAICRSAYNTNAKSSYIKVSRDCSSFLKAYLDPNLKPDSTLLYFLGNQYIPDYGLEKSNYPLVNLLCFRDSETGLVECTNDPFITTVESLMRYSASNTLTSYTLADLVGSLYYNLYSLIPEKATFYYERNLTHLKPYKEIWKKDIIIETEFNPKPEFNPETPTGESILNFRGRDFNSYLTLVTENFTKNVNIEDNKNNITFNIQKTLKVVEFQYAIDYNIDNFKLEYMSKPEYGSINQITYNAKKEKVITSIYGDVQENVLYTINEGLALPLSHSSQLEIFKSWEGEDGKLCPISSAPPEYFDCGFLSDILTLKNGFLTIGNYKKHPQYHSKFNLRWYGKGDDPGIRNFSGGSILNKEKL